MGSGSGAIERAGGGRHGRGHGMVQGGPARPQQRETGAGQGADRQQGEREGRPQVAHDQAGGADAPCGADRGQAQPRHRQAPAVHRMGESGRSPHRSESVAPSSARPRHSKRLRTCWPRRSPRVGVSRMSGDQRARSLRHVVRRQERRVLRRGPPRTARTACSRRSKASCTPCGPAVAGLSEGAQGLQAAADALHDGAGVGQVDVDVAAVLLVVGHRWKRRARCGPWPAVYHRRLAEAEVRVNVGLRSPFVRSSADPIMIVKEVLPNGLTLLTEPCPTSAAWPWASG